tara:strand:- start:43 stop:738 length:696 start_codon:yes stop_codon:yes gene_type:complete
MESKECTKCNVDKPLEEYSLRKSGRLSTYCKECIREANRKSYQKHKEDRAIAIKRWQKENPDKITAYKRKRDTKESKEVRAIANKRWWKENPDKVAAYKRKRDTPEQRKRRRDYARERRKRDPLFKFTGNLRSLIYEAFKRACNGSHVKRSSTVDILGCDFDFFVSYISEQFEEGMTLSNHGEWHLDHDTPISSAKTEEDIIRLNHYTNFKPLWARDNLRKGAKLNSKITQ